LTDPSFYDFDDLFNVFRCKLQWSLILETFTRVSLICHSPWGSRVASCAQRLAGRHGAANGFGRKLLCRKDRQTL